MLLYGAEAWTLLSTDAAALRVIERKVLRKIFGAVRVGDDFRIRFNSELYELLNDMDVMQRINIQQLLWLGHVVRMWRRMLRRDGYLMRGSAEVGEEDDLAFVGKIKSRKPCHRLV